MAKKFDVSNHQLVFKHEKVSEKEKKDLFEKFHISEKDLPKIMSSDAAIEHLKVKEGDIIKIKRDSPTAGETFFYRSVSHA